MLNKIKTIISIALFVTTVIVGATTIINWLAAASVKLTEKAVAKMHVRRESRLILVSCDKEMER